MSKWLLTYETRWEDGKHTTVELEAETYTQVYTLMEQAEYGFEERNWKNYNFTIECVEY